LIVERERLVFLDREGLVRVVDPYFAIQDCNVQLAVLETRTKTRSLRECHLLVRRIQRELIFVMLVEVDVGFAVLEFDGSQLAAIVLDRRT